MSLGRPISWDDGKYSVFRGTVMHKHLFTVAWESSTDIKKPWVLTSQLPGQNNLRNRFSEKDQAQLQAQELLDAWLSYMLNPDIVTYLVAKPK